MGRVLAVADLEVHSVRQHLCVALHGVRMSDNRRLECWVQNASSRMGHLLLRRREWLSAVGWQSSNAGSDYSYCRGHDVMKCCRMWKSAKDVRSVSVPISYQNQNRNRTTWGIRKRTEYDD